MPQESYRFKYDDYGNTKEMLVYTRGIGVQRNNYTCKGTGFSEKEREMLMVTGTVPPSIRTLDQQVLNSVRKVNNKQGNIEKYIYLRSLFDRNVTLAHAVIASDIERFMSIIYTPTVGEACKQYSSMYRQANGLHFYPGNIDQAEDILRLYSHRDIRVAVVTDNQGILGIGDQGAGGIAICLGKLMLYTQGAGIAPWHCLPVSLDVGTDNKALLEDDEYLGWRHKRLTGNDYIQFIQRFAKAFRTVYPNALCQWEDFSKQNAFATRDAHLHDIISFNDDIQGTGSITLAAIYSAMKIKQEKLEDQIYLIHGAGAGGVGIAEQIEAALIEKGLSPKEASDRIFTLDSRGLVTSDRILEPYKQKFAKDPACLPWLKTDCDKELFNVIKQTGVTVLIGTSGQANCFNQQIVQAVAQNTDRPVILPLSNPTSMCEAQPMDIYKWTGGKALTATGSPFEDVIHDGVSVRVGQCNNVFIFPGVGLGTLASGASEVRPSFFTSAAKAVSSMVPDYELRKGVLCPPIDTLREVSLEVAKKVGRTALAEGVSRPCAFSTFQHENDPERLDTLISHMRWEPEYLPLKAM